MGECVVWLCERLRMHVNVCTFCVDTVLNDQGLVCYVQLLTKLEHVLNNADKYELLLYYWPFFHTKKIFC